MTDLGRMQDLIDLCGRIFPNLSFFSTTENQGDPYRIRAYADKMFSNCLAEWNVTDSLTMDTIRKDLLTVQQDMLTQALQIAFVGYPTTGYVQLQTVGKIDGVSCLSVDCPDYDAYKALPVALTYEGTVHGKTGWNSDINMAYYKSTALLAQVG